MAKHWGRGGRPWRRAVAQLKKQSQICAWCGEAIDLDLPSGHPESFSADHIIPLSQLPPDSPLANSLKNLQPMHLVCNQRKGAGKNKKSTRPNPTSRKWI